MNSIARLNSVLQILQEIEDLRLHGDVEGRHRLVADDKLGTQDSARAIPMRWSWPPDSSWG